MACMTVLGEVDIKKLGIVTPHEHIFIDMSVFFSEPEEISSKLIAHAPVTIDKLGILKRNNFAMLDNVQMMDYETQKKEIMEFKYAGGRTVVDASNHGLGRDPTLLKRIAIDTGLNIICGCGYYVASAQDDQTLQLTVEEMEADIVRDLTVGIGHTGIKAGIIGEIGINWDMPDFEVRSLTAACRAQENNTDPWDIGPGNGRFVSDWERVRLVKKIVERGYAGQLLFSCDICLKTLLHTYGGWGYDHVLTHILPMLREVQVSEETIHRVLVENPARWLDF